MRILKTAALLTFLISSSLWAASSGYVGIYIMDLDTIDSGDTIVAVSPRDALRFEVSVISKPGEELLYFNDGLEQGLDVSVLVNGRPIAPSKLAFDWLPLEPATSTLGATPSALGPSTLLVPGVGLGSSLEVSRRGGEPFDDGSYTLRIELAPGALLRSNGKPWSGRGGEGRIRFEHRAVRTVAEAQLERRRLGAHAIELGHYEVAIDHFSDVVAADEGDIGGWSGLGIALYRRGQYVKAAESMERAMVGIRASQLDSHLPWLLARCYVALDQPQQAAAALAGFLEATEIGETVAEMSKPKQRVGR